MSLDELSTVLWRERELLETLLYRLETEEMVLIEGRSRWVGRAAREVEAVLDQIRGAELGRAIEADDAAREVGLHEGASLLEIADAAPSPWGEMLRGHHLALVDITAQISELGRLNRDLLASSVRATKEALLGIDESMHEYSAKGAAEHGGSKAYLLDEAL
ncbi:flagellar export chaperone FlgN [Demequina capsici]|uniref:Flagellar export chaperone FlgN n=1 Tax=Demequina capsici TaxID=3075620 RepID=A0AA96FD14_9MICO|nr:MULTISPECIES: flagellar export chaperone FlgN [unclassified Demequina]WNM24543.1 flagellar export chaperone FlgN [Demequina sp. OYTSA14]WNM27394.1 flagellar export chaperone FlgN [Demequina sp. PMTSA13]